MEAACVGLRRWRSPLSQQPRSESQYHPGMTASGSTRRVQVQVLLAICCAWAPAAARASSYEGALALFGMPFMFLGAFVGAVCWGVARGYHRASSAAFVIAVLNACAISLLGILLAGDLVVSGGAVLTDWLSGFRVPMLLLVLSTWALGLYAPFQVLKYHEARRKERTVEFLDESTADAEDHE